METETIIYKDLNWLKNDFKMTRMFSLPDNFRLEMAILTKQEVDDYNKKLQILSTANGFKMAKIGTGIFLLVYVVLSITGIELLPWANQFLLVLVFAISGALIGKVINLFINFYKLTRIIEEIEKKIVARRPKKQKKTQNMSYAMG